MKLIQKLSLLILALFVTSVVFAGGSKDEGTVKIGIVQLIEHPALDASYQGFVDGLAEGGFVEGENLILDFNNAQGEQANCQTIAQKLVNDNDDLILAIATPAAQAVANLTDTIPILITAVTDPASAKLVESNEMPGTNVTGTSDLTPVAEQISLLKKLVPEAKKVGLMYSSNEQNSMFQIEIAKKACEAEGLEYIEGTVSSSNEIQQVAQSIVGKVDVIYIPTDNMLAAGMATVVMVANESNIPIICGEEGGVKAGALATYGVNYYELGKQTGAMAVDLIKNNKNPAEMPIQYLENCNLVVNEEAAELLGISIPEDL
ncbi:MAG: sugar ABC transporter substrate-binding protein [Treponema sp. CETP13]|nr:MAG: sugar ABC transporter substrate-binding protein [Treponema sp. CETP13]